MGHDRTVIHIHRITNANDNEAHRETRRMIRIKDCSSDQSSNLTRHKKSQ